MQTIIATEIRKDYSLFFKELLFDFLFQPTAAGRA